MSIYCIVLALGIIAVTVFLVLRVKEGGIKALLLKSAASVLFIASAISAFSASGSNKLYFAGMIILSLVLGLLGDICLDLKWIYPDDNDVYTFAGFGSFGIAHIFIYAALLIWFADISKIWSYLIPLIASTIIAVLVILLEKPMKLKYGKFKAISFFYVFILMLWTFTAGSFALISDFNNTALNLLTIGGLLFLISDLILSGTYFGEGKRRPVDIISNHSCYYLSQFVIASSLLFIK